MLPTCSNYLLYSGVESIKTKSKQITFVQPSFLCTDILYLCYFHDAVNLETTLGNGAGD